MALPNKAENCHQLQSKEARSLEDSHCIISDIYKDGIHPETHLSCSTSLGQMANEIIENKELWNEFRHELQKRKVFTSLATKEVLHEFSKARMKQIEEQTSSMDTYVYVSAINSHIHDIIGKNTQKSDKSFKPQNFLRTSKTSIKNVRPFQTSCVTKIVDMLLVRRYRGATKF